MIYGDRNVKANKSSICSQSYNDVYSTYQFDLKAILQCGNLYAYVINNPIIYVDKSGEVITPANIIGGLIGAGIGGLLGVAIADHFKITGWARAGVIAGGALLGSVAGWFAGPAIVSVASKVTMSAITSGKLALTSLSTGVIKALNIDQQAAQKALQKINNFSVTNKHLLGAGWQWNQFATTSKQTVNQWISQGLSIAKDFVVNSPDSFYTIVDVGEEIGANGERFIKIVFTVTGKIITAFPVK